MRSQSSDKLRQYRIGVRISGIVTGTKPLLERVVARLVVRSDGQSQVHEFEDEVRIGRAPDNDLVIAGDGVSRYHVLISRGPGGFTVRDLGSKNGTLLNSVPLDGDAPVANRDVIALPGVEMIFEADSSTVTMAMPFRPAATTSGMPSPVSLDPERAEVRVRGQVLNLPPKEFRALELLLSRRGAVVTKDELARHVWPEYNGDVSDYNIHQVVSRVRRAIEEDPARPALLLTRPGFGYLFV